MANGNEIIDIAGEVRAETERAIQFYDGTRTVWIPKSQLEARDGEGISIPEWLALEKGLI